MNVKKLVLKGFFKYLLKIPIFLF